MLGHLERRFIERRRTTLKDLCRGDEDDALGAWLGERLRCPAGDHVVPRRVKETDPSHAQTPCRHREQGRYLVALCDGALARKATRWWRAHPCLPDQHRRRLLIGDVPAQPPPTPVA